MVKPSLAALNTTAAGWWLAGPYYCDVLASHRGYALIWVLAVMLYAQLIPGLRSLGIALLAGASVASIIVGLAAQSTLGNLIAGLSLLLYRPVQIGDLVQLTVPAVV